MQSVSRIIDGYYGDSSVQKGAGRNFHLVDGLLEASKGGLICVIIQAAPGVVSKDLLNLFPRRTDILICECTHNSKTCLECKHFHIITTSNENALHKQRTISSLYSNYRKCDLPLIDGCLPMVKIELSKCAARAKSGIVLYLKAGLEDPIVKMQCKSNLVHKGILLTICYYQAGPPARDLHDKHLRKHPTCCQTQTAYSDMGDAMAHLISIDRSRIPTTDIEHWVNLIGPIMHGDIRKLSSVMDCVKNLFDTFGDRTIKAYNGCAQNLFDAMKDVPWNDLYSQYSRYFTHEDHLSLENSAECLMQFFSHYGPEFTVSHCNAVRHVLDPSFVGEYGEKQRCL